MNRRKLVGLVVVLSVAVVGIFVVALILLQAAVGGDAIALAQTQQRDHSTMDDRINQVLGILAETDSPEVAGAAIDLGMEILYGGLRPLPSKGEMLEETSGAHEAILQNEMKFALALKDHASRMGGEVGSRALDLALFIEQMNEVAEAVGRITRDCGEGDSVDEGPCSDLHAVLDEETGHELEAGSHGAVISPSYSVKLRSPFIPPWMRGWDEDVVVTDPIAAGQCVVVFKETKGLMLRLHFERIIVVTDPWVNIFGFPRRTHVPIWRMEWVPSEYVKEWNICNVNGQINKTVTQRVKQDIPLNFFWRYYPRAGR